LNLAAATALFAANAHAQSPQPTASKLFEISTFGGINGTYTGLSGGKNLGLTAGVDVSFRSYYGFRPFLEGRGTYPIDGGHIDAQGTHSAESASNVTSFPACAYMATSCWDAGRSTIRTVAILRRAESS
jgi:hypothetical protein